MIHPVTDLEGHTRLFVAGFAQDASGDPKIVTAAATEDNVKVTGATIDRGVDLDQPMSGILCVSGGATLQATETLTMAAEYQESSDGSTWDTAVALYAATTVATGDTGGSQETFSKETALKLKPLKRYVRFNVTPNLSASGTDTANWGACFVAAGMRRLPAS